MRIFAERTVGDQRSLASCLGISGVHLLYQFRAEIAVVLAIEPDAGQVRLGAIIGKCVHQGLLPLAIALVLAQAAREIDQAPDAGETPRAECNRRQSAVRLTRDHDPVRIHPWLGDQVFQYALDIIGLRIAIARNVAGAFDIISTRPGESPAHRNDDCVSALDELPADDQVACTLLQMRIATGLAMIHHQQRKWSASRRLEDSGFQVHVPESGLDRYPDDLLVQSGVQRLGAA